jgi:hypothetical protein
MQDLCSTMVCHCRQFSGPLATVRLQTLSMNLCRGLLAHFVKEEKYEVTGLVFLVLGPPRLILPQPRLASSPSIGAGKPG